MDFYKELNRLKKQASRVKHMDENANVNDGAVQAAQFDIKALRLTANINEPLPFPLFGASLLQNGLQGSYQPFLDDSATALVGIQFGTTFIGTGDETITADLTASKKLRLQYKNGANLDIIELTCTSVPYPQFVMGTFSDIFTLSKLRMTLSDSTETTQFSETITFAKKNIFGKGITNELAATAFNSPFQFRTDIVDVNINSHVDKDTAIWNRLIAVANLSVTFSVFVQSAIKQSSNF